MQENYVDVLIVGAGLSGIAAAYYIQTNCPTKSYAMVEARDVIGGTWDLFRYPGVRSDSDMYTLGYTFNPWSDPEAIADGPAILKYVRETASKYGIDKQIKFNHHVCKASWSSEDSLWTVDIEQSDGTIIQMTCNFLHMCTGYYDYENGYQPDFAGMDNFKGDVIHPQKWNPNYDYADKKVIVIGSGATAVTLVPAMADQAEHVTMLQRSPTYIVARPSEDNLANWMRKVLPDELAYKITRWRVILGGMYVYYMTRWRPENVKKYLLDLLREELGEDFDIETHFTPTYNPWDQRLCLVPDGDLFQSMKAGDASVVTDHIERFTETGIQLQSGEHLEADLIVTATGLVMRLMKGVDLIVDGEQIELSDTVTYKGMMYSNLPNLAQSFGYTNASWTLKCELISQYVCRLLNYMDEHDYTKAVPRIDGDTINTDPVIDFSSGYVQRALDHLPKQGTDDPWRTHQNYIRDIMIMRFGKLDDNTMQFS